MTPEERAKAIIETFLRETTPETTSGTEDCWRIEKHIASALRQAENDAIERAAAALAAARETIHDLVTARGSEAEGSAEDWTREIDAAIRALKHQEI